ncbi:hypothetical protein QVD17_11358 [Tagetes erecta]|uniref:Uncharacterized protein n=1 Tax=Tagetes erecta TaxID=13708 RepID=A0AAD8KTA4_TARER|nr:hypothetical protein QVD17_11358 [Tagetes erecta]
MKFLFSIYVISCYLVKSSNHSSYLDQELSITQSGIVEKRLFLSVLGDSGATVLDLAQHAGYYRIQHTVDARDQTLLEQGIELLVYAGECDLICNWIGNSRWVDAMVWSGQKKFVAASNISFVVGGKKAGVMKNFGPLTFLKVHNDGHMVPMDQPVTALHMPQLWITGKLTPPCKKQ